MQQGRLGRELERGLLEPLIDRTNGRISLVVINLFYSGAGGTGSGWAVKFGRTLATLFLSSGLPVVVNHTMFGGIGYNGCGPRIMYNTSLALREVAAEVLLEKANKLEVRRMEAVELPAGVGKNTPLRELLVALYIQSRHSSSVRAFLDVPQANQDADIDIGSLSPIRKGLGRTRTVGFKVWEPISPLEIRTRAVTEWMPQLSQLLQVTGLAGLSVDVTVERREVPELPSVADLTRAAAAQEPDPELDRRLEPYDPKTLSRVYTTRTFVDGRSVSGNVVERPTSFEAYRNALARSRGQNEALADAITKQESDVATLQAAAANVKQEALDAYAKCLKAGKGTWGGLKARFGRDDLAPAVEAFEAVVLEYRVLAHQRNEAAAKLAALQSAQKVANKLRETRLIEPLRLLTVAMAKRQGTGGARRGITIKLLVDAFPHLIIAAHDPDLLDTVLEESFEQTDLPTMAEQVKAEGFDPESILSALLNGTPWQESAPWGLMERSERDRRRIIVLPRVSEDDLERLQAVSPVPIVVVDSCAAGVAPMVIDFYSVDEPRHLLTPRYWAVGEEVLKTAEAPAFRVPGTNIVEVI